MNGPEPPEEPEGPAKPGPHLPKFSTLTSTRTLGSRQHVNVTLYTRKGCHLCDVAKPLVLEAAMRHGVRVEERNVEDCPSWEEAYGSQIPVAFLAGRKLFKYRVEPERLARRLAAALTAG